MHYNASVLAHLHKQSELKCRSTQMHSLTAFWLLNSFWILKVQVGNIFMARPLAKVKKNRTIDWCNTTIFLGIPKSLSVLFLNQGAFSQTIRQFRILGGLEGRKNSEKVMQIRNWLTWVGFRSCVDVLSRWLKFVVICGKEWTKGVYRAACSAVHIRQVQGLHELCRELNIFKLKKLNNIVILYNIVYYTIFRI